MTTTGEAREVYSQALREYRAARERVSALADQARAGIGVSPGQAKEADTLCHSLFDQPLR